MARRGDLARYRVVYVVWGWLWSGRLRRGLVAEEGLRVTGRDAAAQSTPCPELNGTHQQR